MRGLKVGSKYTIFTSRLSPYDPTPRHPLSPHSDYKSFSVYVFFLRIVMTNIIVLNLRLVYGKHPPLLIYTMSVCYLITYRQFTYLMSGWVIIPTLYRCIMIYTFQSRFSTVSRTIGKTLNFSYFYFYL